MTLDTLSPNAKYDMVHGRPSVIERDNDGSYIYRLNVAPEYSQEQDEQIGWSCFETRVFGYPNKSEIERAVIRSVVDERAELDLVHAYNKHVTGVQKNTQAVAAYKEFLQFTNDLSEQITADLGQ